MIPRTRGDERDQPMPDDHLIDLLVDGELPDDERRALLLRLEAEPDGWRRCALAFLEAQAWRRSLGGLARELVAPRPPSPAVAIPGRPRRPLAPRLAAWAAGLLAAFALGWSAAGSSRAPEPNIAETRPTAPPTTVQGPEPGRHPTVAEQGGGGEEAVTDGPPLPVLPPTTAPTVAKADRPAPTPPASVVPGYLRGQLESRGYLVEERRGLVIGVSDGRRVAVPAEKVRIRYVGRRTS